MCCANLQVPISSNGLHFFDTSVLFRFTQSYMSAHAEEKPEQKTVTQRKFHHCDQNNPRHLPFMLVKPG